MYIHIYIYIYIYMCGALPPTLFFYSLFDMVNMVSGDGRWVVVVVVGSGWWWVVVGGEFRLDVHFRSGYTVPIAPNACILLGGVRYLLRVPYGCRSQCMHISWRCRPYIFLKEFVTTARTVWLPRSMSM